MLTQSQKEAARHGIAYAKIKAPLEEAVKGVQRQLQDTPYADILTGVDYAYNAYGYGSAANAGEYRQFGEVPGAEDFGYNIRIRLFIDTRSGGSGFAATIDVVGTANSGIAAAKEYGRKYAREIRERLDTLPGGSGSARGLVDPKIDIVAIFNEEDSLTRAKTTYDMG